MISADGPLDGPGLVYLVTYDADKKQLRVSFDSVGVYLSTGILLSLDGGVIPDHFRAALSAKGITLSQAATVTQEDGAAWLITDTGKVYRVLKKIKKADGSSYLSAAPASLHLVHSDLTAIITGPNAGRFPYTNTSATFRPNPALPDRRQPYREYTIVYHQLPTGTMQAFPQYNQPYYSSMLAAGNDGFGINYGCAGIGSEVLANRLGVSSVGNKDSVDLKYEEFFLSSWAVGDPAMLVDNPATVQLTAVSPPAPGVEPTPEAAAAARAMERTTVKRTLPRGSPRPGP